MSEPYLLPFAIGDMAFTDMRSGEYGGPRAEARQVFYDEFWKLTNKVEDKTGKVPGCHQMWFRNDNLDFVKEFGEMADNDFDVWRDQRRKDRVSKDIIDKDTFTIIGWSDGKCIGGIVIYNVKIKPSGRVIRYTAYLGPFLNTPGRNAQFMSYMLDTSLRAIDENRNSIRMRLVEWQFPRNDDYNRWVDNVDSKRIMDHRNISGKYDEDFETSADGTRYRVSLKSRVQ